MGSAIETLKLCIGLPGVWNDERSADRGNYEEFSLILSDGASTGIAVEDTDSNPWSPQLPNLKGGGLFVSSVNQEGRQLVSAQPDNVRESMTIVITHSTPKETYERVKRLMIFARRMTEYATTRFQFEPVYLELKAKQASFSQYALVYKVELGNVTYTTMETGGLQARMGIVFEREPYWRGGVRPGENPIKYAWWADGNDIETLDYNGTYTNSDTPLWWPLGSSTSEGPGINAGDTEIDNRSEYTPANSLNSKNFITVPAGDIPGDAPALCMLNISRGNDPSSFTDIYLWRRTGRNSIIGRGPTGNPSIQSVPLKYTLNGADATPVSFNVATNDSTRGLNPYNDVFATDVAQKTTITSGARLTWGIGAGPPMVNPNFIRGKHNIFLRAGWKTLNADEEVKVILFFVGEPQVETDPVVITRPSSVDEIGLYFLGTVDIPISDKVMQNADGTGFMNANSVDQSNPRLFVRLETTEASGSDDFYVVDLIFIPFDEPSIHIQHVSNPTSTSPINYAIYDNSTYLSRGKPGLHQVIATSAFGRGNNTRYLVVTGQPITLVPGVDNNIFGLFYNRNPAGATDSNEAGPRNSFNVRVNIVPRWSGLVDI